MVGVGGGMTHAVVLKLVEPICGRGHHVYMDNFYTSPQVFSDLQSRGFGACGTVRLNRRGVPPEAKQKLAKSTRRVISLPHNILLVQWHDKRVVSLLTTIHDNTTVDVERRSRLAEGGRETVEKPLAVVEYNKYMGGVDRADQLLCYYGFGHRTVRWWRRAFFFLLDMAVVNSYILHSSRRTEGRRYTHEQFRVDLAKELLAAAGTEVRSSERRYGGHHQQPQQPLLRLVERHFPVQLEKTPAGRQPQHNCAVCSFKKGRGRKTTTYKCRQCNLPMCITPCFELHHTKLDPQRYL